MTYSVLPILYCGLLLPLSRLGELEMSLVDSLHKRPVRRTDGCEFCNGGEWSLAKCYADKGMIVITRVIVQLRHFKLRRRRNTTVVF